MPTPSINAVPAPINSSGINSPPANLVISPEKELATPVIINPPIISPTAAKIATNSVSNRPLDSKNPATLSKEIRISLGAWLKASNITPAPKGTVVTNAAENFTLAIMMARKAKIAPPSM